MSSILSYFTVFCYGAAGAADRIDFFIFHTGIFASTNGTNTLQCPPNVIFVNLESHVGLARYLIRVVDGKYDRDAGENLSGKKPPAMKRDELLDLIASFVKVNPYGLVEFKPALGHIFQEYIVNYTHWGYSDFDIIFGDVNRWITEDELNDFDLVTYTFGDQQRLYMRGQFTFHKNLPATINQLWRSCTYLSDMDLRFEQIVQQTQKYHVESAEGCYSAVLMEQRNISIKFAVKAWTDIYAEDTAYTHGIGVSRNPETGRQVLYKLSADAHNSGDFDRLRSSWFEKQDSVYKEHMKVGLQRLVGERIRIADPFEEISNGKLTTTKPCMYWALPSYQSKLCLKQDTVSSDDVVYWINGTLYKQKYENVLLTHSDVITMPLFHFQEWKRSYRYGQLSSIHLSTPVQTFFLTREGAIPMISEASNIERSVKKSEPAASPLGLSDMKLWMALANDNRDQLPLLTYCIQSSVDGSHRNARCDTAVSWQDHVFTKILIPAPGWASRVVADKDVTLVLTLQLSTRLLHSNPNNLQDVLDHLQMNIVRWSGKPCVVILSIPESLEESTVQRLQEKFDIASNPEFHNCLIALVIHPLNEDVISTKALMNMAIDAVPTRWYISGLDLKRGLSISLDTSFLAHRTVASSSAVRGNVFLIPQFAIANDTISSGQAGDSSEHGTVGDNTIDELLLSKRNKNAMHPSELSVDCLNNEKLDPLFQRIEDAWLSETLHTIGLSTVDGSSDEVLTKRIGVLEGLQLDVLEIANAASDGVDEYSMLYSFNESPILLTDNIGPHQTIRTNEIVREIEEFNGQRCFNGVRLTQMVVLGYSLNVLPVAFASSTPKSRKVFDRNSETKDITQPCGAMCFNFKEDEFWILAKIATTEMKRAAKSAVIWAESLGWKPPVPMNE